MYRVVQLQDLDDPRAIGAEKTIVEVFRDDHGTQVMLGGHTELLQPFFRTSVRAGIVGGKFYVALTEKDEVVGTAIWYPPGKDYLADEAQLQEGGTELLATIARVDPELYDWWMNKLLPLNSETISKYLGVSDFKLNNWSLYSLTVLPEHRRKGIARMLVKVAEDQAAEQGASTCFETETVENLHIYGRLGYKSVGHIFITGLKEEDGFDFHSLAKHFNKGTEAEST